VSALAGRHVLVVPSWWPSPEIPIGGIFFLDYARAFAAAGAKVGVIFADLIEPQYFARNPLLPVLPMLAEERLGDIPVIRVRGVHTSLGKPHRRSLRFAAWLRRGYRRYVKRYGVPDFIHAHCSTPAGWAALQLKAAPVYLTEHTGPFSLLLSPPEVEKLTRQAVAEATAVFAVSPNLGSQMMDAGVGREIEVIPNPVAEEFAFAPPPEPERAPGGEPIYHAAFVGRLVREKGVRELAMAIRRIAPERDLEIRWHIVGEGPEEPALRENLKEETRLQRVVWHGFLPKPEVADVLRQSHFLVLPSHGENCPLAVEEALSIGRPVVGTTGTGTEVLVGSEDGVLHRPGDAMGLANAIRSVALNYERWNPRAIAERARQRFSGAAVASRYAEAFAHQETS